MRPDLHIVDPAGLDEHDPGPGGLDRDEVDVVRARHDALLGALVDGHVQQAMDQCGRTHLTRDERRRLEAEGRALWLRQVTPLEGAGTHVDEWRRIGRGEQA